MATPQVNERALAAPPVHHNTTAGVLGALCAAGGIVLAIIGLAGAPRFFDAIADIVVGAAFLFGVWSLLAGSRDPHGERGVWLERVAGWAGVVLGILALLHVATSFLAPIALIVFGLGLAFGLRLVSRSGRVVAGIVAVVLGILAILRVDPRALTLVGLIAVSGMLLLTSPLVAQRWHGIHAPTT